MTLDTFPFPSKLETDALIYLKEHAQAVSLPKDSIIFYQGDICDKILLLTQGNIRLYIQDTQEQSIELYTLNEGEQCIVNTASTLSQTQAIATAEASTDIKGFLLDRDKVQELSRLSLVYQQYIFSLYTIRMQSLASIINDIQFKKLDQRVLEWLQRKNISTITVTHDAIASSLGSTRVVISRVLKELEKKGFLSLGRGEIRLL